MKKIKENNDFQLIIIMLCLCAQLFLSCCPAAIADEFDASSILDDDSSQNDNFLIAPALPGLFDIRTLSKTGIEDFNLLPKTVPGTGANFVAEVKNEQLHRAGTAQNSQSFRIKDKEPNNTEDINRSFAASPSTFVFRPPASDQQDDIKKIIEQIRSITVVRETPAKIASTEKNAEPNTIEIPKTASTEIVQEPNTIDSSTKIDSPVPGTGASLLSAQILQQVDNLIKEPNRISNPLELAEILFKSGKTAQAAICYKQALSKTTADDANFADERAWILFQIGNCLKFDDPNAARESFSQLLNANPQSPWAQAAKTSRDLAEWFQQDEPDKLITELKK